VVKKENLPEEELHRGYAVLPLRVQRLPWSNAVGKSGQTGKAVKQVNWSNDRAVESGTPAPGPAAPRVKRGGADVVKRRGLSGQTVGGNVGRDADCGLQALRVASRSPLCRGRRKGRAK
jgi:hypothetical protein